MNLKNCKGSIGEIDLTIPNDGQTSWLLMNMHQGFENFLHSHPLQQDDPRLVKKIRDSGLILPPMPGPYVLNDPHKQQSQGQTQVVKLLFEDETGPLFFVECGALDGEKRSNTLSLERGGNWQGLLIEGDPQSWQKIISRHRKAHLLPRCVSTKRETMHVNYGSYENLGRILLPGEKVLDNFESYNVTCYPLFAILSAMKIKQVDISVSMLKAGSGQYFKRYPLTKLI